MTLYTPQNTNRESSTMLRTRQPETQYADTEEKTFHDDTPIAIADITPYQSNVMACINCKKAMKWTGYVISFSVYKSLWRCSCGTTVCVIDA